MQKAECVARIGFWISCVFSLLLNHSAYAAGDDGRCASYRAGEKQIYWGDLHVHSGYSLDAWGYGTAATPAAAYAFARGKPLTLPTGNTAKLERPLDFMAVTDHAEWFNLLYLCSDPQWSDHSYCDILTEKNAPLTGTEVFAEYVLPTITKAQPQPTEICQEQPEKCALAHQLQWRRIQQQTNQANEPCEFTSFNAYEWSATPDFSHNHRNIIFAGDAVTADAIDYMRFPSPQKLWTELNRQCRPEDDCDVIAIPHNTNMGDGKSFDVETESTNIQALRAKYERLVEIHQEKGNSECLSPFDEEGQDCDFEISLTKSSRPAKRADYTQAQWERMRGSYVRRLLLRGLYAYEQSGKRRVNPLQLGIIGSTDNHTAAGGFVEEDVWPGSVFGAGDFERTMVRRDWNPGGLVAVWAEENTRESLFASLKRREVYATSGPRIRVRLAASAKPLSCSEPQLSGSVAMGGELAVKLKSAHFLIQAQYDRTPLQSVEIVRGRLVDGELQEQVFPIWRDEKGALDLCVTWQDPEFDRVSPTFWYARVQEAPTPRWSAHHCRRADRCEEYPNANVSVRERAWTSPVWFLPH